MLGPGDTTMSLLLVTERGGGDCIVSSCMKSVCRSAMEYIAPANGCFIRNERMLAAKLADLALSKH